MSTTSILHRSTSPAPSAQIMPPGLREIYVLLVEDDQECVDGLKAYLERGGIKRNARIHTQHALNVDEAFRKLSVAQAGKKPYDAVILDYYLPQELGTGAAPSLRLAEFCRSTPEVCGRTIQLTFHPTSPALKDYWSSPGKSPEMLLGKDADAMPKLLDLILGTQPRMEDLPPLSDACVPFHMLLVSKDSRLEREAQTAMAGLDPYYRTELQTETTTARALAAVTHAALSRRGFDVVLIDTATDDIEAGSEQLSQVAHICAERASKCAHVFLLTEDSSHPGKKPGELYYSLPYDENVIKQIISDLKFSEITRPLQSTWLAEYAGETATDTRPARYPKGFSLAQFASRLQLVWPELNDVSKNRAREIFVIEEPSPDVLPSIELRNFGRKLASLM